MKGVKRKYNKSDFKEFEEDFKNEIERLDLISYNADFVHIIFDKPNIFQSKSTIYVGNSWNEMDKINKKMNKSLQKDLINFFNNSVRVGGFHLKLNHKIGNIYIQFTQGYSNKVLLIRFDRF